MANFFRDQARLAELPWDDWRNRHFQRDHEDPDRFERYQAEALVHGTVPVEAFLGVVVYTGQVKEQVEQSATKMALKIAVHARPGWYF